MDGLEAIRDRRGIRSFSAEPVEPATIASLIDLAVCAPSALNRQPWSFVVIEGRERLAVLEQAARSSWLGEDETMLTSQPPEVAEHFNLPSTFEDLGLPTTVQVLLTILVGEVAGPMPDIPPRRQPTVHWR